MAGDAGFLPVYLANGDDALKRGRVAEKLRDRISQLGDLSFNSEDFDGENAKGADIVTRAIRERMRNAQPEDYPIISSACPAIVRLIRVRFPDLLSHIIDIRQPMEVAAMVAKKEFCKKHNVEPEDVGCFFITPCAAKMTAIRNPIGHETSAVDGAISMLEIYGVLASHIKKVRTDSHSATASSFGVGWANSGGEAEAVSP